MTGDVAYWPIASFHCAAELVAMGHCGLGRTGSPDRPMIDAMRRACRDGRDATVRAPCRATIDRARDRAETKRQPLALAWATTGLPSTKIV